MAVAYTPGLQVTPRARYVARRTLPIEGNVLVQPGQKVQAEEVVARAELPGPVTPIALSRLLGVPPAEIGRCLLKQPGERVEIDEPLARNHGIFGFFKSEYLSKTAGVLETVSTVTGQVLLRGDPVPVQVRAFVAGVVTEVMPAQGCVIEADVALVQGIFGIGGEAFGPLRVACRDPREELSADRISEEFHGAVVVGGARMTGDTVRRAIEVGAAAVISGGIDDADLRDILGYDLGVAITGTEEIGTTIVITEGFGEIAMAQRTHELLCSLEHMSAAVNGATQIRAGVLRPEILVPIDSSDGDADVATGGGVLEVGAEVRIIRDPWFGRLGTVTALPPEPQVLESGSKARVLEVRCSDGTTVTVPRANVEIVGAN